MERLGRDKHSSLLQKFAKYGGTKFYRIGLYYAKCHLCQVTCFYIVMLSGVMLNVVGLTVVAPKKVL